MIFLTADGIVRTDEGRCLDAIRMPDLYKVETTTRPVKASRICAVQHLLLCNYEKKNFRTKD